METGKANPSQRYIQFMYEKDVNLNWLYSGSGEMLLKYPGEKTSPFVQTEALFNRLKDDTNGQIKILLEQIAANSERIHHLETKNTPPIPKKAGNKQ